MPRFVWLPLLILLSLFSSIARADFLSTTGGHGPFSQYGTFMDRGEVWLFSPTTYVGEFWLGNMGDVSTSYVVHPSQAGMSWVALSSHYTYAIAYEFEVAPGSYSGRNAVLTVPYWNELGWAPQAIIVSYNPPCPTDNAGSFTLIHVCSGDYTPMDGGGKPTVTVTDAFGNSLKLPGNTNHVECEAHLPNYPNLSHPSGLPNDVAVVYGGTCP